MSNLVSRRHLIMSIGSTTFLIGSSIPAIAASQPRKPIVQPPSPDEAAFIKRAFEMRTLAVERGDRPYGAVVARDNEIIGQAGSQVTIDHDPTAHAELLAIRDAGRRVKDSNLRGAILYSSFRPCPMCEAAAYWAGIGKMIYGQNADDAGAPALCR